MRRCSVFSDPANNEYSREAQPGDGFEALRSPRQALASLMKLGGARPPRHSERRPGHALAAAFAESAAAKHSGEWDGASSFSGVSWASRSPSDMGWPPPATKAQEADAPMDTPADGPAEEVPNSFRASLQRRAAADPSILVGVAAEPGAQVGRSRPGDDLDGSDQEPPSPSSLGFARQWSPAGKEGFERQRSPFGRQRSPFGRQRSPFGRQRSPGKQTLRRQTFARQASPGRDVVAPAVIGCSANAAQGLAARQCAAGAALPPMQELSPRSKELQNAGAAGVCEDIGDSIGLCRHRMEPLLEEPHAAALATSSEDHIKTNSEGIVAKRSAGGWQRRAWQLMEDKQSSRSAMVLCYVSTSSIFVCALLSMLDILFPQ